MSTTTPPEPDTAAIRAKGWLTFEWRHALALCDALDAARAERDEARGRRDDAIVRCNDAEHRAEAAEARIAAAHEIHDEHMEWAELNCPCTGCFMARALTGETS